MLNQYTIRPYTQTDETQWVRCRVLAFLDSAYFDDVQRAKTQYNNPTIELVAVSPNNSVAGFIEIECERTPGSICSERTGLAGMIWNIGVHPDHRRRGIAQALLSSAIALAKQQHIVRLEAWTRDDPHALAWYRAQGFQLVKQYLHVYLTGPEAQANLTSLNFSLNPIHVFAHCTEPTEFENIRLQFKRVHDCQLFELSLT